MLRYLSCLFAAFSVQRVYPFYILILILYNLKVSFKLRMRFHLYNIKNKKNRSFENFLLNRNLAEETQRLCIRLKGDSWEKKMSFFVYLTNRSKLNDAWVKSVYILQQSYTSKKGMQVGDGLPTRKSRSQDNTRLQPIACVENNGLRPNAGRLHHE